MPLHLGGGAGSDKNTVTRNDANRGGGRNDSSSMRIEGIPETPD
jgi:hypothetical protein